MGGPIWIMFLPENITQKNFFDFVNIPFDAQFLTANVKNNSSQINLSESYRVSMEHPIRTSYYGTWTPEEGLIAKFNRDMYYRRKDLEGFKFNAGSLEVKSPKLFVKSPNYRLINFYNCRTHQ